MISPGIAIAIALSALNVLLLFACAYLFDLANKWKSAADNASEQLDKHLTKNRWR